MFYVLGYVNGKKEFMTSQPFLFLEAAQDYMETVNQNYFPFIVQAI